MVDPEREDYYQILGVARDASRDQVERAYQYCLGLYDDASVATYSLLDAQETAHARERIQNAYKVLGDAQSRRAYDVSRGWAAPDAPLPEPPPAPSPDAPVVLAPTILPTPLRGADLRRFREARAISLREIATTTKIGVRYLEYIEADRHKDLPASVYLRGFLQQYARAIGLDPRRTAEDYMAHAFPDDSSTGTFR